MTIEDFYTKFVEGYLFSDMENMAKIKLQSPATEGACGYPMVSGLLSGCELLGGLLSQREYSKNNGNVYFVDYWNNFLGSVEPKYKTANLAQTVYNLARHGINHTFVAKEGILVNKFSPNTHLVIDSVNSQLSLDATTFFEDFKKTYWQMVKPLLLTPNKINMQDRLNEMAKEYISDSQIFFAKLPIQPPIAFPINSNASTASFTAVTVSGTSFKP